MEGVESNEISEMEPTNEGEEDFTHWWWAAGSGAQLGMGIRTYLRGYAGDSRSMPAKAFGVASLFVGAAASAAIAGLKASGINTVEDLKDVGANIRAGLGVPPRNNAEETS